MDMANGTTTTPEAVEEHVSRALVEFGAEAGSISPSSTWDELDVDSLDLVELAQMIEDEYGVEVRENEMEKLKTVSDVVTLVVERAGGA